MESNLTENQLGNFSVMLKAVYNAGWKNGKAGKDMNESREDFFAEVLEKMKTVIKKNA